MGSSKTLSVFKSALTAKKVLQTDFYKVSFTTVPSGVGLGKDEKSEDESFDIWCQGTDLPGRTMTVLEIKKHGFKFNMPNRIEYDGKWKTSVLLDMSLDGYKKLLKWQEVYSNFGDDIGGERGFPTGVAQIQLLDNKFEPNGPAISIYGVFPTSVPAVSFKQDSSEAITVDVEFGYSYCSELGNAGVDPILASKK